MTNDGTFTYAYDGRNRLLSATNDLLGWQVNYGINGLGQRVSKETPSGTNLFVYDEAGRLLGEYDGAGQAVHEMVYLDDLLVAVVTGSSVYYAKPDHVSAVEKLGPSSGADAWRLVRDPFGNGIPNGNIVFNGRFPGQYADLETQTSYNMARDYDPSMGRYRQSDPIGLKGGINTYAYVLNNPVIAVDPKGLKLDINLFPISESIHDNIESVEPAPGHYAVGGHGNTNTIYDKNEQEITPENLAKMIQSDPRYKHGMTVDLYSCETGKYSDGFAQNLANKLGTIVTAPDKYLWVYNESHRVEISGAKNDDFNQGPDPSKPGIRFNHVPTQVVP